jgi:hypothetical protein
MGIKPILATVSLSLFVSTGLTAFATDADRACADTHTLVESALVIGGQHMASLSTTSPQKLQKAPRVLPTSNLPSKLDGSQIVVPRSVSLSTRAITPPSLPLYGGTEPPYKPQQIAQRDTRTDQHAGNGHDNEDTAMSAKGMPVDAWGMVLEKFAQQDAEGLVRFNYAGLQASPEDMAAIAGYIDTLAAQSPSEFERNEAMVYWANLYNALTVQIVAQNYPVKSIRKIKSGFRPGPWKKKLVVVEGEKLSLDNIEHDILRPNYKTPLVHYMVNCASIGCPNLNVTPWKAETLEADQTAAARAFINSPRGVTTDKGRLIVSSIYSWFDEDFGGNQQGVLDHLAEYADEDLAPKLIGRHKIDKYDYDWGVNAP